MTEQALQSIEANFRHILSFSTLFAGRHLTVDIILNPCAGAFSPASRLQKAEDELSRFTSGLLGLPRDPALLEVRFHHTECPGHATEIVAGLIDESSPDVRLIVSVGGDGTHGEVLTGAVRDSRARNAAKGKLWFFRFPFGTGNDGADADTPAAAARALLGDATPSSDGHLLVRRSGSEPLYGFNIASLGLDAYVALLTNRLKGSIAGDLYKVLADVMTLLYEPIVGVSPMTMRWSGDDGVVHEKHNRFIMCVFGVSGTRTYGDHKPILPGFENLCAIERIGVIGKIRLKGRLYRGEHVSSPLVSMHTARRLVIEYAARVPLQIDGETRWLTADDFPLEIELHDDSVPVLRAN
jgi:diacylglycerol kinase family enzyme